MDDLAAVSSKLQEERQPKMSAHWGENDVRDLFRVQDQRQDQLTYNRDDTF